MEGFLPGERLAWFRCHWRQVALALVALVAFTTCGFCWLVGIDGPRSIRDTSAPSALSLADAATAGGTQVTMV